MTYGLDTSVVIRLLMNEPPELVEKVAAFVNSALAEGNDFFISDLVVSEAYFVLQKYYGKSKELAVSDLRAIADSPGFSVSPEAMAALETPDAWKASPGMIDRMIANGYAARGYVTISCERSFAKLDLTEVIK